MHDLSRVMRLPGFMHRKGKPFATHIVKLNDVPRYKAAYFRTTKRSPAEHELDRACDQMRAAAEHTRNNTLNKLAFSLGQRIGAGVLDESEVRERLADAARRAGLHGNEINKTLDSGITAGIKEPRKKTASEDALALDFAKQYAKELRYIAQAGRWMEWDGTCWRADSTLRVFDLVRNMIRNSGGKRDAKTVAAVERLARSDRRLAATMTQWDADPWLLNTPDGVVDLRRGITRKAEPEDYMTKMTAVAPAGACPLWHKFLQTVTGSDVALQEFLQRVCGYGLTGLTIEEALFFLWGHGQNGKTKFIEAISGAMGDYQKTAPIDTFLESKNERHPTELAGLHGARLVTAAETEQGRQWAEKKIQTLTGGDKIAARFMHKDFFEYKPQFKLMIHGNHKPGLKSVNKANQRRINLVPFVVTIPEAQRDNELGAKLQAEWPGILTWAIQGCLAWQQQGLAPPAAVTNATRDYFEEEDAIARWIDACCTKSPQAWTKTGDLFASWSIWAASNGEFVGSVKHFVQALQAHQLNHTRRDAGPGFIGLALIAGEPSQSNAGKPISKANETIKKTVYLTRETDAALCIEGMSYGERAWVPRSQTVKIDELGGCVVEIELQMWCAKEKGVDKWQSVKPINEENTPF